MSQFDGCHRRILRAQQHRSELAKLWNDFCEEEPFEVNVSVQRDGSGEILVDRMASFPDACALELGETLYQLRAALDGTIYQAAIVESGLNPPPNEHQLEFPICNSNTDFVRSRKKLGPISEDARKFIESVQPYNTPVLADPRLLVLNMNRTLGILNNWARMDRHRQLHVVDAWPVEVAPMLWLPDGVTIKSFKTLNPSWLRGPNCIATFELNGYQHGMRIKGNPNLAIDPAVAEAPEPAADNDTLGNRLAEMIFTVTIIVKQIEALSSPPKATTAPTP